MRIIIVPAYTAHYSADRNYPKIGSGILCSCDYLIFELQYPVDHFAEPIVVRRVIDLISVASFREAEDRRYSLYFISTPLRDNLKWFAQEDVPVLRSIYNGIRRNS